MPVCIAKYNESRNDFDLQEQAYGDGVDMLGTIRVPRNLSLLTERLPKAQYDEDKPEKKHRNEGSSGVKTQERPSGNAGLHAIAEEDDYRPVVGVSASKPHP